jgi:hypothetical protein
VVGDKSAICLGDGARRSEVERVEAKFGFVNMQKSNTPALDLLCGGLRLHRAGDPAQ